MKRFGSKRLLGFLALIAVLFALTVFCASAETEGIFTYSVANDEATLTKVDYNGVKDIVVPETLGGYPVTTLANKCFTDDEYTFGDEADSVFLPKTVLSIPHGAFYYSDIKRIVVDEENPNYSSDAYGVLFSKDKTELIRAACAFCPESYTIPESVKTIRTKAFETCILLEEVCIPGTVEAVNDLAFFQCIQLKKLTIEEGATKLTGSGNTFAWCYALEDISLPSTLGTIAGSAFTECNALETIVIPEGITAINYFAFESCPSLKQVYLPSTLTVIGTGAFGNCTALTDVCYAGSEEDWANVRIDTSAYSGSSPVVIDTCNIHYNVPVEAYKTLSYENDNDILTFSGSGTIPGGWHYWDADKGTVTTVLVNGDYQAIGADAFADYPELTTVILNTESTSVADGAFANCPNLQAVLCFGGSNFGADAFVFEGACKIYENADAAHTLIASQGDLTVVPYRFADNTLQLLADVNYDSYEFFDTMAAFTLKYDNIQKLTFQRFTFDSIPLYYYPEEGGAAKRIVDNTLVNGEMYPLIYVDGEATPITFNALVQGLADKSITSFSLISSDENHKQIKDTQIATKDDDEGGFIGAVKKAMRWVITLLNKLFKIVSKLGK